MTSSPSSVTASPPSPRVFDTPPVTPPQVATPAECPPAPRPQVVTRNSTRFFIVADLNEMEALACNEGDFASLRGTSLNFVRQEGTWNFCRPHDVYEQARVRGLLLSPTSCWTQGPMRLSAEFWNGPPRTQSAAGAEARAQHQEPQILMRPPVSYERATLTSLHAAQQRSAPPSAPPTIHQAPANQADRANTEQGKT